MESTATGLQETRIADRLNELRRMRGPGLSDFASRIRKLVVVASSSRGGSSMVTELLRRSPALVHLRGEINPILRLAGLGPGDSDRLDARHLSGLGPQQRQVLEQELSLDAGAPRATIGDEEQFAVDLAWRLVIQWPAVAIDPGRCVALILDMIGRMRRQLGWAPRELPDPRRFLLRVLDELRAEHPQINPWYHDLPKALLAGHPGVVVPQGAPGPEIIEEPPFIVPPVWRRADASELATKPMLIKTPSNAYRMGFLRALFPHAEIAVLHLTRNPAAAVNGLYDGWRYPGFHAFRVAEPLRISGYADELPGERWWWKFDLAPGWRDYADAPLMRVCAFQWLSCHRAILAEAAERRPAYLRIRFEDFLRGPNARQAAVRQVTDWLGIPFDPALRRAAREGLEPMVTTSPPAPGRWRARERQIRPVIDGPIRQMAGELGYGSDDSWV